VRCTRPMKYRATCSLSVRSAYRTVVPFVTRKSPLPDVCSRGAGMTGASAGSSAACGGREEPAVQALSANATSAWSRTARSSVLICMFVRWLPRQRCSRRWLHGRLRKLELACIYVRKQRAMLRQRRDRALRGLAHACEFLASLLAVDAHDRNQERLEPRTGAYNELAELLYTAAGTPTPTRSCGRRCGPYQPSSHCKIAVVDFVTSTTASAYVIRTSPVARPDNGARSCRYWPAGIPPRNTESIPRRAGSVHRNSTATCR
jgi:hypothetical protein